MADRRWTGAVSGDASVAGNYDDTDGGAGAVPINGDNLYFTYGAVDCDTNLGALAAVNLGSFVMTNDYTGNLGSSTGPTFFDTNAANCWIEGGGNTTHYIDIVTTTRTVIYDTGSKIYLKGSHPTLELLAGTIEFSALTCTTTLVTRQQLNLTVPTGCTINGAALIVMGGRISCQSVIGNMDLAGGIWDQVDGNAGTISLYSGAFKFNSTKDVLTKADIFGGMLDCSEDPEPKTITDITIREPGTLNLDNGAHNIVVTNAISYLGGALLLARGSSVTIA